MKFGGRIFNAKAVYNGRLFHQKNFNIVDQTKSIYTVEERLKCLSCRYHKTCELQIMSDSLMNQLCYKIQGNEPIPGSKLDVDPVRRLEIMAQRSN